MILFVLIFICLQIAVTVIVVTSSSPARIQHKIDNNNHRGFHELVTAAGDKSFYIHIFCSLNNIFDIFFINLAASLIATKLTYQGNFSD